MAFGNAEPATGIGSVNWYRKAFQPGLDPWRALYALIQ